MKYLWYLALVALLATSAHAADSPDNHNNPLGMLLKSITAPGTPSSGNGVVYFDSTDKRGHDKNDAGVVGTTIVPSTCGVGTVVTAISSAGVVTCAAPTATPACAQLGNNGSTRTFVTAVDLSNTNDTSLTICLPTNTTDYRVNAVYISHASASLATAVCGIWTGAAKSGTTVVGSGASGTALSGVTATTVNTAGGTLFLTNNVNTAWLTATTLFWSCSTTQAATVNVLVQIIPLN